MNLYRVLLVRRIGRRLNTTGYAAIGTTVEEAVKNVNGSLPVDDIAVIAWTDGDKEVRLTAPGDMTAASVVRWARMARECGGYVEGLRKVGITAADREAA